LLFINRLRGGGKKPEGSAKGKLQKKNGTLRARTKKKGERGFFATLKPAVMKLCVPAKRKAENSKTSAEKKETALKKVREKKSRKRDSPTKGELGKKCFSY